MAAPLTSKRLIDDMLGKGWHWSESDPDVLLHPRDENIYVRYDRVADTLRTSPAMDAALGLVIPTTPGRSQRFWKDEQKAIKGKTGPV